MADEERPGIIDRVPDFSKAPYTPEKPVSSLGSDPHGIGGKARAMHDAHKGSNAPDGEGEDNNRIRLRGESVSIQFPETIDQTDFSHPGPQLHIDISGTELTIKQRDSGYIRDQTKEDELDDRAISKSAPAQSFSLRVGDREILVSFDTPPPIYTAELSASDLEDVISKVKSLYPHLDREEDIATATKFEELLLRTAKEKAADAILRAEDLERKLRDRKITLAIGRDRIGTGRTGIRISPTIEDALSGETSSVQLIELVREDPSKPAQALDISEEGIVIDMTDNPARSVISKKHAIVEFNGKNEVIITDGSESGQPSTNGTIVTLL